MTCFEHVLGRYSKQAADDRILSACLVAWATNMGLGRMGEISDITFATLTSTSENFLRPETLKAANDCISNAIAALTLALKTTSAVYHCPQTQLLCSKKQDAPGFVGIRQYH